MFCFRVFASESVEVLGHNITTSLSSPSPLCYNLWVSYHLHLKFDILILNSDMICLRPQGYLRCCIL